MIERKPFSFLEFNRIRKNFLLEHKQDSTFIEQDSSVLISASHAVPQIRLGKYKVAEIGTLPVSKIVADMTKSNLLVKTKNNFDDANVDNDCRYRKELSKIIKTKNIKYLIDIHGLAKHRPLDVNLGINFGQNINSNTQAFDELLNILRKNNFIVEVDNPFAAGPRTIAGTFAKECDIWAIQIEINSKITNEYQNIIKCNLLCNCLALWISKLK